MSHPHFIYLSGTHAVFLREMGSSLSLTTSIARSEDDANALERFKTHLDQYRGDEFVFIVDSVNEELVVEEVPRLRPRDLRAMMTRRVEQRTREKKLATWRAAPQHAFGEVSLRGVSLGKLFAARALPGAPGGHSNAAVGNAANSGPDTVPVTMSLLGLDGIQAWIDAAIAVNVRIADVVSPALLASTLAQRLGRGVRSGLIVTVTPAGLRQTLVIDGQTRFTRLARLADSGADGESIAAECTRTLQYLLMNQLLSRKWLEARQSKVWILSDGIVDAERLPSRLKADSAGEIEVRRLRADEGGARRFKGPLPHALGAAHLWADSRLLAGAGLGYATPAHRNQHVAARLARTIVATGLAFSTLGALALAGVELVAALDVQPTDPAAERKAQEHRELAALLQRYAIPGTEMRRVVELDSRLRARALDPLLPLQGIARAMVETPEVRLERLSWQRAIASPLSVGGAGPVAIPAGPTGNTPPGNALPGAPLQSLANGGLVDGAMAVSPPAIAPDSAANGADPADPAERVEFRIEARIDPLRGKASANASARRFADSLARQCNCTVELSTPPFDPSATTGFSADLKAPESNAKPEFVVTMSMRSSRPLTTLAEGAAR